MEDTGFFKGVYVSAGEEQMLRSLLGVFGKDITAEIDRAFDRSPLPTQEVLDIIRENSKVEINRMVRAITREARKI